MIKKFRLFNLIISQIFLSILSIKLGIIITDWLLGNPNPENINSFVIFMLLAMISILSISLILLNINLILFKESSKFRESD